MGGIFLFSIACVCVLKLALVARLLKKAYSPPAKLIHKGTGIEVDLSVSEPLIRFFGCVLFLFGLLAVLNSFF